MTNEGDDELEGDLTPMKRVYDSDSPDEGDPEIAEFGRGFERLVGENGFKAGYIVVARSRADGKGVDYYPSFTADVTTVKLNEEVVETYARKMSDLFHEMLLDLGVVRKNKGA